MHRQSNATALGLPLALMIAGLSAHAQTPQAAPAPPADATQAPKPPSAPVQAAPADAVAPTAPLLDSGQNLEVLLGVSTSPEMAQKTRAIAVLRQILALKMTEEDIDKALPLLKQLQTAEKALPVHPTEALDAEYQALLTAKPGDPIPPNSAEAMRQAQTSHRQRQETLWADLTKALGKTKADGLHKMLNSSSSFFSIAGGWNSSSAAPLLKSRDFYTVPSAPTTPNADRGSRLLVKPKSSDTAPKSKADPVIIAPPADPNALRAWAHEYVTTATGQKGYGAISARGLFFNLEPRVSLSELIDLLEKKSAAMKGAK